MRRPAPDGADRLRLYALVVAAACGLGLVAVGLLAFSDAAAHERDSVVLLGFDGLYRSAIDRAIEGAARLVDVVPYAVAAIACIAVALSRGMRPRAVAVAVVLVGSGAMVQVLKHVTAQQRYADWMGGEQIDPASWPSGHATAVMALALCAVLVAPASWRAATALIGGVMSVIVTYATLALAWHYPSDVIGGFLVAGMWAALARAALARVEDPDGEDPPARLPAWLATAGCVGSLAAATVVAAASQRVVAVGDRPTVAAGALAIAALAAGLLLAAVVAAPTPAPDGAFGESSRRRRRAGATERGGTILADHREVDAAREARGT